MKEKEKPFNSAFDKLAGLKKAMDQKQAEQNPVAPTVKKTASAKPFTSSGKSKTEPEDDGLALFLRTMDGTQKVKPDDRGRVEAAKRKTPAEDSLALADFAGSVDFAGQFSETEVSGVAVHHVPGLNKRVLETLLFTESDPDAQLDLHGLRAHVAETRVTTFLRDARREGHRRVLIITGKGEGEEGVLKRSLPEWLRGQQLSRHVMAFCVAPRAFGGDGATSILLRRAR